MLLRAGSVGGAYGGGVGGAGATIDAIVILQLLLRVFYFLLLWLENPKP